ncbi:MAG: hypothetical protein KIT57_22825 [Blastocatellales bacterium]|nr:hypothetical protein [Blastocatellales bacterium]
MASSFREIPDRRDATRIKWEMPAALMSAYAMFFFQHPNLLNQQRMKKKLGARTWNESFG